MSKVAKAMQLVGNKNKYQKIMMVLFIVIFIQLGMMLLGSSFIFMSPTFDCNGKTNVSEEDACKIIDQCVLTNDFTISAYAGLYCDKQGQRDFVQSSLYIGSISGLVFMNPMADVYGKRTIFVLAQYIFTIGVTFNIIGALAKTVVLLVLGQICVGFGCYAVLITGYVIVSDLFEDELKQRFIIVLNAVWAIAQIIIGMLFFWYNKWINFMVILVLIPNIGACLYSTFFIVESPYFLVQKKHNKKKTMECLRKIAMYNNKDDATIQQAEELIIEALQQEHQKKKDLQAETPFTLIKHIGANKLILKTIALVTVLQIAVNSFYYGVQFSLNDVGTNYGFNILIAGIIETLAFFTQAFFITKLKRRFGMFVLNLTCCGLGFLFLIPALQDGVPATVMLGFCRLINSYSMGIVPMMQSENFPHKYRNTAWGFIEGLSQLGSFMSPFLVTICINAGISPMIVFGIIVGTVGIVPLKWLRETLHNEIQTEEDLEIRERKKGDWKVKDDDEEKEEKVENSEDGLRDTLTINQD